MKPKQVKRYRVPAYPTKIEILSNPELLEKNVPAAWTRGAEMACAVTVFLAANGILSGCDKAEPVTADQPATVPSEQEEAGLPTLDQPATIPSGRRKSGPLTPDQSALVAPIFEHGDGRGVTGCIVVVPSVFLSEEEALQIIKDEISKYNLEFSEKDVLLENVSFRQRAIDWRKEDFYDESRSSEEETTEEAFGFPVDIPTIEQSEKDAKPMKVDLADAKRKVLVKYVSESDYFNLGGLDESASVQSYYFREVAELVAKQVSEKEKGIYFGVFYDPMAYVDPPIAVRKDLSEDPYEALYRNKDAWRKFQKESLIESKRLLRMQVKDFADWLKAQGVI